MDAAEYADWMAFHQAEPFGGDGEDARLRIQIAWLLNGFSGAKLTPADVRFSWGDGHQAERGQVVMVSFAEGVRLLKGR